MPSYIELSYVQVGLITLLILVNAAISLFLQLNMERTLLIAAGRAICQLLLVGLVLEWVFHADRWYLVVGILALMTGIAGATAVQRNARPFPGIWFNTLISIWAASWVTTAYGLAVINGDLIGCLRPQYAIPLMGMVLGNTLNGNSVGLNAFTESLVNRREEVESALALGATRWEAARPPARQAVRMGMIPIVNTMMIVGVVSLPGLMTGQLLAGTPPIEAVKYQIVIIFMIASTTALGTVGVVVLSYRRLFNSRHQFLVTLIGEPRRNKKRGRG